MGIVVSREPSNDDVGMKKRSKVIDEQLMLDKKQEFGTMKLLLLGPAECGKSTVLKQMKILNGIGFSDKEIALQRSTVYTNTILAMRDILAAMQQFSINFSDLEREVDAAVVLEACKTVNTPDSFKFSPKLAAAITKLWKDCGIQECFSKGHEFQLVDSAKYFFDNVDRISDPDYVPNEQDILRARVATTGIVEIIFVMKAVRIRMFDVGGQRSQRRKWIHCFDSVDAVFFIISLSEYNMVLMEDGATNRTHESLNLFEIICDSVYFAKASMILFLNKTDIFAEKIKIYPLTIAFPEYKGSQSYEECLEYIKRKFTHKYEGKKKIYTHRTCATDTRGIEFVITACLDMVISANLSQNGLM